MEIAPLLPHLTILIAGLLALLVFPFVPVLRERTGEFSLLFAVASALPVAYTFGGSWSYFGGALMVDDFANFSIVIFHTVAALIILASLDFVEGRKNRLEYYSLVLLATGGMDVMASSAELVTIFIALEITSLSTYALVAFHKDEDRGVEGAIKYFLVGAFSSGILLFGISLIYGATGTTHLPQLLSGEFTGGIFQLGAIMLLAGLGFKVAAVPFHAWAPDAYEGAPTPISGYLASASKAAGFVVLLRVFVSYLEPASEAWLLVFAAVALLTMVLGNMAALPQRNMKRLLAYSGVAHTGYLVIVLVTLNEIGTAAAMAHLLVYAFINTGPFLFVALTSHTGVGEYIDDVRGLYRRAPYMAFSMGLFMFALTGLPPTGGFFTKLFIFLAAMEAGYWWLAAIGVVMSGLSLYYYIRIVKFMFVDTPPTTEPLNAPRALRYSIIICALATVATFVAFSPLWDLATAAASSL